VKKISVELGFTSVANHFTILLLSPTFIDYLIEYLYTAPNFIVTY